MGEWAKLMCVFVCVFHKHILGFAQAHPQTGTLKVWVYREASAWGEIRSAMFVLFVFYY